MFYLLSQSAYMLSISAAGLYPGPYHTLPESIILTSHPLHAHMTEPPRVTVLWSDGLHVPLWAHVIQIDPVQVGQGVNFPVALNTA